MSDAPTLHDLLAAFLWAKKKPAYVLSNHIRMFQVSVAWINNDTVIWCAPIGNVSGLTKLRASDPSFFRRISALIKRDLVRMIAFGDPYAIAWKNAKTKKRFPST